MKIRGTGKSETLVGSSGTDLIDGGAGNDVIIGGVGNDTLTGGKGADTFVFGDRSQYDTITDFNAAEGDTIVFGSDALGAQSLYSGQLYDGLSFDVGGSTCTVGCIDINSDGVMDTQITFNGNNVFLLGYSPDQVSSASLWLG
jgi:Ca2+-binding RTX toxin-like protein